MANVMTLKNVKNHTSRSGFDLSRRRGMSVKASQLEVVFAEDCLPGDNFPIEMSHFTRSMPLNRAAFTRMREYIDFYFVPYNLLWDKFNYFVYQLSKESNKATSINEVVNVSEEHPYCTTRDIILYLRAIRGSEYRQNFFGYQRADLTCKLLHELRMGDYYNFENDEHPLYKWPRKVNLWKLLAYQKVYFDYYRDTRWERVFAPAFNLNYMTGALGTNALPIHQIVNSNDGGQMYNMFDMRYSNWSKDMFMGVMPNSQFGDAASVDLSSLISPLQDFSNTQNVANIHLRAVMGNGNAEFQQNNNGALLNVTGSTSTTNTFFDGFSVKNLATAMGLTPDKLSSAFTILALRKAESLQKMIEVTQANDLDIPSQADAHWNVQVSDALSDKCRWLGGDVANFDISEVPNTNITGDNEATIAGKGTSASRGKVQFSTDVHGVLIGIYRIVPVLEYSISGIHKSNLKTKVTDYAQPEFDRTGMVQVPLIELTANYDVDNPPIQDALLGYAPQYYEYKTSYDDVCGALYNGGADFAGWVAPFDNTYIDQWLEAIGRSDVRNLNYTFFKINPNILDPLFAVNADDTVNTDQFVVNIFFDCKPVRKLDYDGLPY